MKVYANHLKGNLYEYLAVLLLLLKGYRPLEKNIQTPHGETDILAQKGETVCVVEVKYRQKREKSHTAIHPTQKDRLIKQAKYHLKHQKWSKTARVDVIFFYPHWPFVDHIKNVWDIKG